MKKIILLLYMMLFVVLAGGCEKKADYDLSNNTMVIKIIYSNGDYELIDHGGQAQFVNSEYDNYVGYRYFDEAQFEELISNLNIN